MAIKQNTIDELVTRGVAEVIVRGSLVKKLASGKRLRVKLGIDPSGADLHLGHMVVLRKLREFQELGHQVVIVVGTFTGQIGDPTGKMETRKPRTEAELKKNAQHYLKHASKMLDVKKVELRYNADWFNKMSFRDVVKLASTFTAQQMLQRDMFKDRMRQEKEVYLHELLYPLMQGYDSVVLKADVELGGTDQTFNLLAGRVIQEAYGQSPQDVMTVPILEGTDGVMKMGKSLNNYIGVMDPPAEMFGKIMSLPDQLIIKYFELNTFCVQSEINKKRLLLKQGANPRELKAELARNIVELYHSSQAAQKAAAEFDRVFVNKGMPADMEEVVAPHVSTDVMGLLVNVGLANTRSDAKRLVVQGAVMVGEHKITDWQAKVDVKAGTVIKAGKRKFVRIV